MRDNAAPLNVSRHLILAALVKRGAVGSVRELSQVTGIAESSLYRIGATGVISTANARKLARAGIGLAEVATALKIRDAAATPRGAR